jgi:hypothetical protein
MKNLIKKILREEIYNIFEDEEFDPFGHIGQESDDPEELGINLEEDCVLGFSKSNSKLEWPYFNLPSGYSCPFATVCKNFPAKWEGPVKGGKFNRPSSWEKNIKPGPKAKHMCYAARAQGQYPGANIQAFSNLSLLNKHKGVDKKATLIVNSLRYHKLDNTDILRIHEAGDFYSQEYFDAWLEVARRLPGTLFYAYTTSLPFWLARKNSIPKNFKIVASMDEENEQTIIDNGLRYSKMVHDVEEAKQLGLRIDVDDSIAWGSDESFALILHGPQPKGSEAAQSLKRNKDLGLYGKEGIMGKAKERNQQAKNALRDKIKRQLRGESYLRENDFDWISDVKANITCDQLTKLKKGDVVKVDGSYRDGRQYNFDDAIGIVRKAQNYTTARKRAYSDTEDYEVYMTENGGIARTGYVELAFDEQWGEQGYSADKKKPSIKDKILNLFKKKDDTVSCDKYNCTKIWCKHLDTVSVAPMNRMVESIIKEDMEYWGYDGDSLGPLKEIDDEWGSDETELSGHKGYDGYVFIHRNLHKPPYWSIKKGKSGGPVIGYDTDILLSDVTFKVQQGGKERVRREMKKNVHAGVVGKIQSTGGDYNTTGWTLVTYNPYKNDTFVEYKTGKPIHNAREAILKNTKEVWVR